MNRNLSKHLTMAEAIKSQTAVRLKIDNSPSEEVYINMKIVAERVFEPIREHFGVPIGISSFYRCDKLNKAVGGAKTSQHVKGEAIDIDADIFGGITNKQIFDYVKNNLEFDKLIWEYGDANTPAWVHVSFRKGANRRQVIYVK